MLKSATGAMGAVGSGCTATISPASRALMKRLVSPSIPRLSRNFGDTCAPVNPMSCASVIQQASSTPRSPPTTPPSASASLPAEHEAISGLKATAGEHDRHRVGKRYGRSRQIHSRIHGRLTPAHPGILDGTSPPRLVERSRQRAPCRPPPQPGPPRGLLVAAPHHRAPADAQRCAGKSDQPPDRRRGHTIRHPASAPSPGPASTRPESVRGKSITCVGHLPRSGSTRSARPGTPDASGAQIGAGLDARVRRRCWRSRHPEPLRHRPATGRRTCPARRRRPGFAYESQDAVIGRASRRLQPTRRRFRCPCPPPRRP